MKLRTTLLCVLLLVGSLQAATLKQIENVLGKSYTEVFKAIGYPTDMFSVRQKKPLYDDIVMVYKSGKSFIYLYFYNNHFYRMLIPSNYKGSFHDLKIGDKSSKLDEIFKKGLVKDKEYSYFKAGSKLYVFKVESDKLRNIWVIFEGKDK